MLMGQVWSKASFDGEWEEDDAGPPGGRGSVLAVTAQNATVPAPLNARPVPVSVDRSTDGNCEHPQDRVRSFTSLHPGGAHFLLGDGSVRFVSENINQALYRALSTIAGGERVSTW
jgi:prepilin-type processing-associated H-X9-DG protein